jgi:hypothetical protein|tara:strand:- start:327 stop:1094 length:768 start_codon:yes stop_codon:yes gene_type:complete
MTGKPLFYLDAQRVVDKAIASRTKAQVARTYLGGSQIGTECTRRIQYSVMLPDSRPPVEPRVQRIFDVGNILEEYLVRLLREAGLDVKTTKPDGKQYGFFLVNGRIRGHVDGVIVGTKTKFKDMEYPCLVEFKSAKDSSFKKFLRDGVMAANPVYYSQVQFYQRNMELLNPALFVMINKDTQDIYYELIHHNPAHTDRLINKASDVLTAVDNGTLVDRAYTDKNNWNCKYCDFKEVCWEPEGEAVVPDGKPSWME